MAKRDRYTADHGHIKFRVIEFELSGENSALVEGLKNLATTISRSNGPTRMALKTGNGTAGAPPLPPTVDEELEEEAEETTATPKPPRGKAGSSGRPEKLAVLDLDFTKATGTPLADYVKDIGSESVMKKFTAVAAWYKQHFNMPTVTVNHIYTAFQHLHWNDMPKKPRNVFADLKNKVEYKWFEAGSKPGEFVINHIGVQRVAEWRKVSKA